MSFWLVMVACGLLTFLIRLSFIAGEGRLRPPHWFRNALPFVPVAALTALVAPDLLLRSGSLQLADNPRLYAGLVAIVVAWRFRNAMLTIAAGFATLFALHALLT
jgi:branched-subunit amino acid transport protein